MAVTVENQIVEPVNVIFGEDIMQSENITCVADVSSSLNNKYFNFYTPGGVHHYAWFDTGAGVDPAVPGSTGHQVAISANNTAAQVATAAAAILTAVTGFDCTADGAVLNLVGTVAGYAKPSHEGAAATGFTFEVNYYGDIAIDLGAIDGDVAPAKETGYVDVTSHQTGSNVLSHISTGMSWNLPLVLKETSTSQLRKIMATGEGDVLIPDGTGVSSTEVFGWGNSRQFKQTIGRSRKLVLHPVTLPTSNKSRDITFWKAFPTFSEFTFSGENVLMLSVEFKIYPDYSKDSSVAFCARGDGSQTLT